MTNPTKLVPNLSHIFGVLVTLFRWKRPRIQQGHHTNLQWRDLLWLTAKKTCVTICISSHILGVTCRTFCTSVGNLASKVIQTRYANTSKLGMHKKSQNSVCKNLDQTRYAEKCYKLDKLDKLGKVFKGYKLGKLYLRIPNSTGSKKCSKLGTKT